MYRCAFRAFLAVFCLTVFFSPALADKRVALVIGNSAYKNTPLLPNPRNDAQDVAASLTRSGFETILGLDLDKAGMDEAAIKFARAARTADIAIFYYSGHAMQFSGVNYLIPVDAKLTDEADLRRMTKVDEIIADLQPTKSLRILVLDSCRNNPMAEQLQRSIGLRRAISVQHGLAKIDSPEGMIVAYATQAGRTADDGHGRNSPFTTAFLKHIEEPDEIGTVFRRISSDVYETTGRIQLPEVSWSLIGEFYLNGRLDIAVQPGPSGPCAAAGVHWRSAESLATVAAFEDHLARFPNCAFSNLARARIESLKKDTAVVVVPTQPMERPPAAASPPPPAVGRVRPDIVRPTPDRRAHAPPNEPANKSGPELTCSGAYRRCVDACVRKNIPECVAAYCNHWQAQCMATGCWRGKVFNRCGVAKT